MTPTIYALHALAVSPEMWHDVRDAAPDLTFVAPDLAEVVEEPGSEGSLATFVRKLADRAPAGPLLLLGASIGANFALELAAVLGERVRGTLLVVPGPPAADEAFLERTSGLLRTLRHAWNDEMAAAFVPLLVYRFGPRYAQVAERVERMLRRNGARAAPLLELSPAFAPAAELLPRIPGPVRILVAADNSNPIVGPHVLEDWRQLLGTEAVQRVSSASEFLPMERPEVVVEALRALIG